MKNLSFFKLTLIILMLVPLIIPSSAYLASKREVKLSTIKSIIASPKFIAPQQSANIKIVAADGKANPVVNQGNMLTLKVVDASGQAVTGFTIESGSPDIVSVVNASQGIIMGNKTGYATVTVRKGSDVSSSFVIVTQVGKGKGAKVLGQSDQDITGTTYLADPVKNQIFKVEDIQQGALVYAGSGAKGKSDGSKNNAQFAGPIGISVDDRSKSGIFIADTLNHSIRKINYDNTVQTMLGTGAPGILSTLMSVDQMSFSAASDVVLSSPQGIAVNSGGNIYVADTDNNAIYYVDFNKSTIQLLAGQPGTVGKQDGVKRNALFNRPTAITLSPDGTLLNVVDSGNNVIRQVFLDGTVTTLGSVVPGKPLARTSYTEFAEDSATNQEFKFNKPISVTQDLFGTIYVTDQDGVDAIVPTKTGKQQTSLAQSGKATFTTPTSVVVRGSQVFVSDAGAVSNDEAFKIVTIGSPVISKVSPNTDTLAGGTMVTLTGQNFGPETRVFIGDSEVDPDKLMIDSATSIRFIVPQQKTPGKRTLTVRTRGGMVQAPFSITAKPLSALAPLEITTVTGGVPFIGDGGSAKNGILFSPSSIITDGMGNIYVSDDSDNRIRKIDVKSGVITTIAGNGTPDFTGDGGQAVIASLNRPSGLAMDSDGNIYVADRSNGRIRKINPFTGTIDTIVGSGKRKIDSKTEPQEGIDALKATIDPKALVVDSQGNIFIVDNSNNRIRLFLKSTNKVFTLAGTGESTFKGDGGLAKNATLNNPSDIALTPRGIAIADRNNNRVRLITGTSLDNAIITTIAGCGDPNRDCRPDDNVPATMSAMKPIGLDVAGNGDLLVVDDATSSVRKINSLDGTIVTVAGGKTATKDIDSGLATEVRISPVAVAVIGTDSLVIADNDSGKTLVGRNRVRGFQLRTDPTLGRVGFINTLAGGGSFSIGDGDLAINASLSASFSLSIDEGGNIFIADLGNHRVREITKFDGKITTVAGGNLPDSTVTSIGDGNVANRAVLFNPISVAYRNLRLFIGDLGADNINLGDSRVRRVEPASPGGIINTVVGGGKDTTDGVPAIQANIDPVVSVAVDRNNNIFILEVDPDKKGTNSGGRIRRIDGSTGIIRTVAGTGDIGFSGDGGPAINARFNKPFAITVDKNGNLFVADTGNDRIRKIDVLSGIITTVLGGGTTDKEGTLASDTKISKPLGVLVDDNGNLFVSDSASSRVRVVDAKTNKVTTVAGKGGADVGGDGGPAIKAGLKNPAGLALDKDGNLYIADTANSSIRVVKGPITSDPIPAPQITNVNYSKSTLTITGMNFSGTPLMVMINGQDKTKTITSSSATGISLKGKKKDLTLKKGSNTIIVGVNGLVSNMFIFNLGKSVAEELEETE